MVKEIDSTYKSAVQESEELERVKAELEKSRETIAALEASYRELLNNDADAVIILDHKGIIHLANTAAGEIFGCEPDELLGKQFGFPVAVGKTTEISVDHADGKTTIAEMRVLEINCSGDLGYLVLMRDMAERRQMIKSLRESEERYKTLTEHLNVGVYRNTPGSKGKFIEMNPANISMFGYNSREEFLGVDVASLYQNPEDRERFSRKLLSDGFVRDEELQLKRKDGTPFTASVSAVAVKNENGEAIYFDGIIEDITERKRAAEALRESEERYRALVENASEVILVAQDGILKFVNARTMEITGYSMDELTSKPFTDFVHPDDRDMVIDRYIERLKGSDVPDFYTVRIIDKDGSTKWAEVNSAIINWEGRPATLNFLTDITERRQAEQKYRELIENSGTSIAAIGINGEIILLNSMAAADMGGQSEDFIGKKLHDLFPEDVADEYVEGISRIIKSGEGHVIEKVVMLPSGRKWFLANVQPIIDSDGEISGIQAIARDITGQRQAEEREALAYDQGRLEIVDTILHNIGNAMTSVTTGIGTVQEYLMKNKARRHFVALANAVKRHRDNFGDYVSNDPQGQKVADFIVALADEFEKCDEEMAKAVKRAWDSAERIVEITRATRAIGRRGAYRKDVNLRKAVENVYIVMQDSIRKRNINFEVDLADAPEEISIQESQFHEMLVNLVKNSYEAIDDLKAIDGLSGVPSIKLRSYVESDSLVIEVIDNGIGIEKDTLETIFRSDYTTKKDGTGLGLHSIANFVKACGGQIQALSDGIGKGATMKITLPTHSGTS